jgi:hypothetical protein
VEHLNECVTKKVVVEEVNILKYASNINTRIWEEQHKTTGRWMLCVYIGSLIYDLLKKDVSDHRTRNTRTR